MLVRSSLFDLEIPLHQPTPRTHTYRSSSERGCSVLSRWKDNVGVKCVASSAAGSRGLATARRLHGELTVDHGEVDIQHADLGMRYAILRWTYEIGMRVNDFLDALPGEGLFSESRLDLVEYFCVTCIVDVENWV